MPVAKLNDIAIDFDVTGNGPALLLHAGWGQDKTGLAGMAAALGRQFTCITLSPRGSAGSDCPPGPYTTAQMATDAVALLDHLGVARAHVLGASMGGAVAQEIALGFPERVERLVLLSTGARPVPQVQALVQWWCDVFPLLPPEHFYRAVCLWVLSPATYGRPGFVDMVARNFARHAQPTPEGVRAQTAAIYHHDTWDRLPQIEAPTLVINGADDRLFLQECRLLAERIPGARYLEFERAGHAVAAEAASDVLAAVRSFLHA
jgi:3-oxoadipate enol-lactonase